MTVNLALKSTPNRSSVVVMSETIQKTFPSLPERLFGLGELATNLWWSWHPAARMLFKMLDRQAWKESGHNPLSLAVIGLLLAFIIPSGKGSYSDKYFLDLHRHEWGDLYLYLSLFLLGLLILHIWLNWRWIIQSTKRYFGPRWGKALLALSFAWILVLFFGWIMMKL